MQVVILVVISLAACARGIYQVESLYGYHERVAIPMATRIKAAEEDVQANHHQISRIVGGSISLPNSHPYLGGIVITYENNPGVGVCGSVLVSRTRALTAAHCWFDGSLQASRFVVVLGSNFLFSGGDRFVATDVITYPEWNAVSTINNIAVIYLPNLVILSNNIQPIALATNMSESFAGAWAVATGYGRTSDAQTSVSVLTVVSEVEVQVITVAQCQSSFGAAVIQGTTICTNGTGGVGTCKGDAGSPLFVTVNSQPVLIGINTFSAASGCERGLPSGYSRITSFLGFITQHL